MKSRQVFEESSNSANLYSLRISKYPGRPDWSAFAAMEPHPCLAGLTTAAATSHLTNPHLFFKLPLESWESHRLSYAAGDALITAASGRWSHVRLRFRDKGGRRLLREAAGLVLAGAYPTFKMPHPFKSRRRLSSSRIRYLLVACTFLIVSYYYIYRNPTILLGASKPRDAAGNSTLGVSFLFSMCLQDSEKSINF
jgi:hypothetical protein